MTSDTPLPIAAPAPEAPTTPSSEASPAATPSTTTSETSSAPAGDTASLVSRLYDEAEARDSSETPTEAPVAPSPTDQATRRPDGAPDTRVPPTQGPIPFASHKAALTNARNKAREEAFKEVEQKLGSPQRIRDALDLLEEVRRDPAGFAQQLAQRLGAASRAPSSDGAQDVMPPPDLQTADGRPLYSAEQAAKLGEWHNRQVLQQVRQEYGPLRDRLHLADLKQHKAAEAKEILAQFRSIEGFADLEPAIAQLMAQHDHLSLERAYIIAFHQQGLPKMKQTWENQRSGQIQRKVAASSGVNPGAARVLAPPANARQLPTRSLVEQLYDQAAAR